jgi:hypothetical protein
MMGPGILLPLKLKPPLRHGPREELRSRSQQSPSNDGSQAPVALVISILKGETSVAEAARQHGLTVAEAEDFLLGAENALAVDPGTKRPSRTSRSKSLKQKMGVSDAGQRHRLVSPGLPAFKPSGLGRKR